MGSQVTVSPSCSDGAVAACSAVFFLALFPLFSTTAQLHPLLLCPSEFFSFRKELLKLESQETGILTTTNGVSRVFSWPWIHFSEEGNNLPGFLQMAMHTEMERRVLNTWRNAQRRKSQECDYKSFTKISRTRQSEYPATQRATSGGEGCAPQAFSTKPQG